MTDETPSDAEPQPAPTSDPPGSLTGHVPSEPVDEVIFLPGGMDGIGASLDFPSDRPRRPRR
jgi:hypothetical protein